MSNLICIGETIGQDPILGKWVARQLKYTNLNYLDGLNFFKKNGYSDNRPNEYCNGILNKYKTIEQYNNASIFTIIGQVNFVETYWIEEYFQLVDIYKPLNN